jgi:hypothetical protein
VKNMKKMMAGLSSLALVSLGTASGAFAQQTVGLAFPGPVQLVGSVTELNCTNAPGPQITLDGTLTLTGGVNVELIFRNNINQDVHTTTQDVEVTAGVAMGTQIVIPKQPVDGGVGGNPFIWVQILDTNGNALTPPIFLGRCVQGPLTTSFLAPLAATATLTALDCTNNPGPDIDVEGALGFTAGVIAEFIFSNQNDPVDGTHLARGQTAASVTVVPQGFSLTFPKQPVLGGVGGNPWISVQFVDGHGNPFGSEVLLGRCVQLLPGN